MPDNTPKRAVIYVRPEVRDRLKAIAALRGVSVGRLIAELLKALDNK